MEKNEYKKEIIDMIRDLDNPKALKKIYSLLLGYENKKKAEIK